MGMQVGIDVGTRSIKVIAGRKKGPVFELQRAFELPVALGGDPEDAAIAALGELGELLGKAPGSRFGVSGREVIIRYTKVPPVPIWRLRLLMEFEVREMAEQAGDALASDYNLVHVPGQDEDEDTVLVAVVKEAFLASRFTALTNTIGEPRCGMPCSLALFNAYVHSGELYEGEFVFLVDIGDRNVEIVLQKDGEILFARNLAAGGGLLTDAIAQSFGLSPEDAEAAKEQYGNVTPKSMASYASGQEEKVANTIIGPTGQLASMIQSSLAFSRAQTGLRDLQIGRILLSGGGANLRGLPEYLGSSFNCPVERFQPESGLDTSTLDGDEQGGFESDPGRYAVALGLALSDVNENAFLVDLVPDAAKKKRAFVQGTLFLWLAAAAAVIFLGFHFYRLSSEAGAKSDRARIESRKAQKARREYQAWQKETDLIKDLNEKSVALRAVTEPATALLRGTFLLQDGAPTGVWIERIQSRRIAVDIDEDDPKKGREMRTIVQVAGIIVDVATKAEAALQAMSRRIQQRAPGADVRIVQQKGGTTAGSNQLSFVIEVELFGTQEPPVEGN